MILLTGASGYVGRAVAYELAGQSVAGLVLAGRGSEKCIEKRDVLVPSRYLDLANPSGLREVVKGVTTVIHLAGLAHNRGRPDDYERVNLRGSLALAEAALAEGLGRFVYMSSLNVVPGSVHSPTAAASDYPAPSDHYARSKWLAEQQLEALFAGSQSQLDIIRPALVYDDELTANLGTLHRFVKRCHIGLPDVGERMLVCRQDLARLITTRVDAHPLQQGRITRIVATDGQVYSAQRIARAFGAPAFSVPVWMMKPAARFRDWLSGQSENSTWRGIAGDHWTGDPVAIDGWQPRLTLEAVHRASRRQSGQAQRGAR